MRTWSLHLLLQLFRLALSGLHVVAAATPAAFKSRAALQLENLALRHQLGVLRRSVKRPKLTSADRLLWTWLYEVCLGHRQSGNRHWLAPKGLPVILEIESSSWPSRTSTGVERNPPSDSEDEPRES